MYKSGIAETGSAQLVPSTEKLSQLKMKSVVALCTVFVAAFLVAAVSGDAGRSACKDESEVGQTYTHHFDAAKYWLCETLGTPAKEVDCPPGLAYMHLLKECIPWASYIWKKPEFPPTVY